MPKLENKDDALKMWKAKGYDPSAFEEAVKTWEGFRGDWTDDYTFWTWYYSVKDATTATKEHAKAEAKAPADIRESRQYKTLSKTREKIEGIHQRLKLAIEDLGEMSDADKAKNTKVIAIYNELRVAETNLKKNINQYYKNPSQATINTSTFTVNARGYEQFLKDHPFERYTVGGSKATLKEANISAITTGKRFTPKFKEVAEKTEADKEQKKSDSNTRRHRRKHANKWRQSSRKRKKQPKQKRKRRTRNQKSQR